MGLPRCFLAAVKQLVCGRRSAPEPVGLFQIVLQSL
jgi:hypothetical protein